MRCDRCWRDHRSFGSTRLSIHIPSAIPLIKRYEGIGSMLRSRITEYAGALKQQAVHDSVRANCASRMAAYRSCRQEAVVPRYPRFRSMVAAVAFWCQVRCL
jgi:hypothetical protein